MYTRYSGTVSRLVVRIVVALHMSEDLNMPLDQQVFATATVVSRYGKETGCLIHRTHLHVVHTEQAKKTSQLNISIEPVPYNLCRKPQNIHRYIRPPTSTQIDLR